MAVVAEIWITAGTSLRLRAASKAKTSGLGCLPQGYMGENMQIDSFSGAR